MQIEYTNSTVYVVSHKFCKQEVLLMYFTEALEQQMFHINARGGSRNFWWGGSRASVASDILGVQAGISPLDFFFTQMGSDIDISNK